MSKLFLSKPNDITHSFQHGNQDCVFKFVIPGMTRKISDISVCANQNSFVVTNGKGLQIIFL